MAETVFEIPEKGEARSSSDGKVKTALTRIKETVNGKIGQANFEANAALAGKWYTPVSIATEESTSSTSFTTLTTKDEITGVVVPTNGLLVVTYLAAVKASASTAGKAAIFVGSEQLKVKGTPQESSTTSATESFQQFVTCATGMTSQATAGISSAPETVSTGTEGGSCVIHASAGTYTISLKFKATSGSVTAKERKLWVYVLGA